MPARKIAAALLAVFIWPSAGHAGSQSIPASAEGQIEFNTPSGNIGCIYTPKGGTSTYQPETAGRSFPAHGSSRATSR
ncbi:hypothetical protein [Mesorhizobium hawassense]|uniref:hypothetical protein n=1 Tax=Mesorhizobium hawassense TaxID=1209954 RepID=UPI001FE20033|nr:hypothetical protein [Mesorhizobium hawassense]